jgi:hypothetical protein
MGKLTRPDREDIAARRLQRVLARHGIATARTLEQKISDAGPTPQRVDPHVLTDVRNRLLQAGTIERTYHHNTPWFHLPHNDEAAISARLAVQLPVLQAFTAGSLTTRIGQALEIATYRALSQRPGSFFFGRFTDLDQHADDSLFSKEEPPQHVGVHALHGKQRLDFMLVHPQAGPLGLECKNVREWLYPDRLEVKDLIRKCLRLDAVPVLVARRIPFVTFWLLSRCGVVVHQTYNQLLPVSASGVATQAARKDLLGYFDIRIGNSPDARLLKFTTVNLPRVATEARAKFDTSRDLLQLFVDGDGRDAYREFAARVRRRTAGTNEGHDWPDDPADWPQT